MTILIATPAAVNPVAPSDPPTATLAVAAPVLAELNLHAPATQSSPAGNRAAAGAAVVSSDNSLDALTPRATTPASSAALSSVIAKVQTTLNSIDKTDTENNTQLAQDPNYQALLHALNAGQAAPEVTAAATTTAASPSTVTPSTVTRSTAAISLAATHATSTVSAPSAIIQPVSGIQNLASLSPAAPNASSVATPNASSDAASGLASLSSNADVSTAPAPAADPARQPPSSVNAMPYFKQLLGELESTYGSSTPTPAPTTTTTSPAAASTDSSELDLFLKWLSINSSGSLTASA